MANLSVELLRDVRHGGDAGQPQRIAELLGAFLSGAKRSLDLAIYDCRLEPPLDAPFVDAIRAAAARGVAVRIAYDASKPDEQTTQAFASAGADPAPIGTQQWLRDHFGDTTVVLKPITTTSGHLMHDKYVVRDRGTSKPAVWTGSANWTNDAWTLQENNVVQVTSRPVANGYTKDFEELWAAGAIKGTGADADGHTRVDGSDFEWAFGPGDGKAIDAALVALISAADSDVALATMVLTSAAVIGALHDALDRGVRVHGIYDSGQMGPIVKAWKKSATGKPKAAMFEAVAANLHHRRSTPYTPTSKHDFLHHKVLVVDERAVMSGSHNFSSNATGNAENSFTIHNDDIVGEYVAHIAALEAAYPGP